MKWGERWLSHGSTILIINLTKNTKNFFLNERVKKQIFMKNSFFNFDINHFILQAKFFSPWELNSRWQMNHSLKLNLNFTKTIQNHFILQFAMNLYLNNITSFFSLHIYHFSTIKNRTEKYFYKSSSYKKLTYLS